MTEFNAETGTPLPDMDQANYAPGSTPLPVVFATTDQFEHMAITAIVPSLTNPRKTFDPVTLAELAESIKASGVHQPVLLRPLPGSRLQDTFALPEHNPHHSLELNHQARERAKAMRPTHELVAGERRFRACKLAGVSTIPALIRDLTDNQVLEIQIVENLQRDDISPLEEAEGYQHLCEATGISKEDVGTKIGMSRAYVYGRLKLLDLSQDCKQALRNGDIDASRALLIARIPDTALQQKAVAEATRKDYKNDVISTRELQIWLQKNVMLRLEGAPFNVADAQLCQAAGSCKTCPKRTGASPDLFSDVDGADICTDPPCYQAKEAAHRAQLVAHAEAKGMRVIDGKEAKAIFKLSFQSTMGDYTRLDQRRHDTGDADGPTLRKLLGTDTADLKAQGIELVLIEHPYTRELIEAASTVQSEALLITRGLIKQTLAAESADHQIQMLRNSVDAQVKKESRLAIFATLVKNVHAFDCQGAHANLIPADLLRAWLMSQTYDMDTDDTAECLDMPKDDATDDEAMRLRIQSMPDVALWKALAIIMIRADLPSYHKQPEDMPAFKALAETIDTDIDQVAKDTRTKLKTELEGKISDLKKLITPDKPVAPKPAEVKPSKPARAAKTTKEEAAKGIAQALQAQLPMGFAIGQRVRVLDSSTLALTHQKWAGKEGEISQQSDDRSWIVTFQGRNGGMAKFDSTAIEVVA